MGEAGLEACEGYLEGRAGIYPLVGVAGVGHLRGCLDVAVG